VHRGLEDMVVTVESRVVTIEFMKFETAHKTQVWIRAAILRYQ
jgi:hypothetical protein